ncbi:hypothetical protein CDAR_483501 [Caerostris darwini]|uniref:Uncharacterized protein n=1 Tax=Caerostris darwini TaxID=1538125 RepID=A0AAV4TT18_9ARAC|nr:hypothetical protein CDAR_483501 [Caerostris darwini]
MRSGSHGKLPHAATTKPIARRGNAPFIKNCSQCLKSDRRGRRPEPETYFGEALVVAMVTGWASGVKGATPTLTVGLNRRHIVWRTNN